jgi:putative FmdB family regulatory protein
MPSYEYSCADCGAFQASRPIVESAAPHACPACGGLAPRALASPHVRTAGAAIRYIAESRNEKSAHEPITEHRLKGTTGHHHAHGKPHEHGHAKSNHRPWMIGH